MTEMNAPRTNLPLLMARLIPAARPFALRLAALLALSCLMPAVAPAQAPANTGFDIEVSRQESIYHGRGKQRPDGYVIDRALDAYAHALAPGFAQSLNRLGSQDRWLDIGAGRGLAILDYYSDAQDGAPATKASAVAMSIEDRRNEQWQMTEARLPPGKLRYIHDRRLREYSPAELGRFQLITDVIGGFSYTEDLSLFMETVLGLLTVNGQFYTVLQDVRQEQGGNKPHYPGSPFLTEIRENGSDIGACAWLKRISCVEVSCHAKADWVPPIESYRVHKVCEAVNVPKLQRGHFTSGTPPERSFTLTAPEKASPAP